MCHSDFCNYLQSTHNCYRDSFPMSKLITTLTDLRNVHIQIVISSHTDLHWKNRFVDMYIALTSANLRDSFAKDVLKL